MKSPDRCQQLDIHALLLHVFSDIAIAHFICKITFVAVSYYLHNYNVTLAQRL